MSDYNPLSWYWIVGSATDKVFSSAAAAYVPVSDPTYKAWLAAGNAATAIDTEDNLNAVLMPYGVTTTGPVRLVSGIALAKALSKTTKNVARDIAYIAGRDQVPETAASVARMAAVDSTTPKAWFDAALAI